MTTEQITLLKQLGPREVVSKYFPRYQRGEITKAQYAKILEVVKAVVVREEAESVTDSPSPERHGDNPGSDREPDQRVPEQDQRVTYNPGEHPDKAKGQSQKARLLKLLQDHEPHTTIEIMAKVYRVGEDRGIARIASRINDLRNDGHKIETIRITQTLTAYRLV